MDSPHEEHRQAAWRSAVVLLHKIKSSLRRFAYRYAFTLSCAAFALAVGALILNPPSYRVYQYVAEWLPGTSRHAGSMRAPGESVAPVPSHTSDDAARLFLLTEPSGATVQFGSLFEAVSPVTNRAVPAGVHRLLIKKNGYATFDSVLVLRRDRPSFIRAVLQVEAATRSPDEAASATRGAAHADETALPDPELTVRDAAPRGGAITGEARDEETRDEKVRDEHERSEQATGSGPAPEQQPDTGGAGTLRIASQPAGASVRIGGRIAGTTPLMLDEVPAGSYRVVLEADGYAAATETITVRPDQADEVEVALNALTGQLSVLVEPWGAIYIDGRLHRPEADVRYTTTLPVGEHRLVVEHPALGRWERTVTVEASTSDSIAINFNEPMPGPALADTSSLSPVGAN